MSIIRYKCPFCGGKLKSELYTKPMQYIAYCDNDKCGKFCTDASEPSRVLQELKAIKIGEVEK